MNPNSIPRRARGPVADRILAACKHAMGVAALSAGGALIVLGMHGCRQSPEITGPEITQPTAAQTATSVRFATIGDFGNNSTAEADVANLVKSWNPDHIIALGDNNYPD